MTYSIDNYLIYIGNNYYKIKENFKRIFYSQNIIFDEDIFHTTIYNCYTSLNNNKLFFNYENDLLSYLFASLKMNTFRDKKYSRNKNTHIDFTDIDIHSISDIEYQCDKNIINSELEDKFGKDLVNLYYKNINGISISTLQHLYNVKNLKAKLKEIKNFVEQKRQEFI